jgi:ankyrin repeat protein
MKRRLSDSSTEFIPNKRRKIDPEIEAQLIEELTNDIKTDEECTADEELLLNSDDEAQLKQLIDRLPDLNQRFGYLKQTPLMITIENCMTDLAEYLIKEKKVDLTVVDENEQSALHYACENDEEEIANIIIEQMKDDSDYLNQLDGDAMSPLIFAVQNCCTSTVAKLLSLNVAWRYTYDGGNEKMMNALLEANDVSIFKEFQTRLSSAYWKYIEKSKEQSAIVNRALENSNLEILKEILPQYSLENYFTPDDDSADKDDWDSDEESSLALAVTAGDEEIIRYLHERKAWFKNLGHVAVDTDDMRIVKLMNEFNDLTGDGKSMKLIVEAAVENENYEMLEYLFTETDLKKDLEIEETKLSLDVAFLCPESSSFARLLIKHDAELPRKLESWDMNPFAQDFHDRYLRSHLFGPELEWWSPEEANYVRDLGYPVTANHGNSDDSVSPLVQSSNDSKRTIFGYLNCLEDIISLMFTCKQFCEIIDSQDYWKAQWFATYELAVIDGTDEVDWKKTFLEMDKLLKFKKDGKKKSWKQKRWFFEENCLIAKVCVLEGSYNYEVRAKDGTTSILNVTPDPAEPASHFITCGLDEEINFDVAESPLPKDKIKQFLPSGQIGFATYDSLIE